MPYTWDLSVTKWKAGPRVRVRFWDTSRVVGRFLVALPKSTPHSLGTHSCRKVRKRLAAMLGKQSPAGSPCAHQAEEDECSLVCAWGGWDEACGCLRNKGSGTRNYLYEGK